ncbi:MAG: DUF488 domain-containing protein [Candidatus Latescibacterota bacterium]
MFALKRVYEEPEKKDGLRVLVDRLWPRGLSREKAAIDLWMEDIAPDDSLRKWFGHRADRWEEFRTRYRAELENKKDLLQKLRDMARGRKVTLLYAAHDTEHNNAQVIFDYLQETARKEEKVKTS